MEKREIEVKTMKQSFQERVVKALQDWGCEFVSRGSKSIKLTDPKHPGHYYYVGPKSVRWGRNKAKSISLTDTFRGV